MKKFDESNRSHVFDFVYILFPFNKKTILSIEIFFKSEFKYEGTKSIYVNWRCTF